MVTMKDVARYANVSVSTVSRVISQYPFVDEKVRTRVLEAAQALGYRTNIVARSMRQGRTRSLGLVVRDMASTNFAAICAAAEAAADAQGYQLFICNSDRVSAKERRYLDALLDRRVDGMVLFMADDRINNLDLVQAAGTPVVLAESDFSGNNLDRVTSKGEEAAIEATWHLIKLGHQRIAFLAWGQSLGVGRGRLSGFFQAMKEANLGPDMSLIRYCGIDLARAEPETRFLLEQSPRPTALLISATDLTPGALAEVANSGLTVPDDLSILAFDDREATRFFSPPITVMRRSAADLGSKAVNLLLDRLEGRLPVEPQTLIVPFSLLIRGSTRSISFEH